MESNSKQNKSDNLISDCLGTCKTSIGCTCKTEEVVEINVDNNICTCGKNPGGSCGCKTGEGCGCSTTKSEQKSGCDDCSKKTRCSCTKGTHKLEVFDWLSDLPEAQKTTQMVEVQFKNTRKGYYLNSNNLDLYKGDIIAVEASPGHDIGEVTLTGQLVLLQMKKSHYRPPQGEQHRRVYRIAKPLDLEKYEEAKSLEHKTMLRAREIAEELGLKMKISDVEYQGDGNKAIFYYIADERVDFRQLIKVYADQFKVKIEMKQIGARQEAGRVGGIGPCGRELCCSSSISSFVSVSTAAARFQDISLNPQKLAGQCGKLKCCLNYEVDTYVEAQRQLPSRDIVLETKDGLYYHFKTDILSGTMMYSTDKHFPANLVSLSKDRVYEVIRMNKNGNRPLKLNPEATENEEKQSPKDILEQENIDRFDSNSNRKKKIVKGDRRGNAADQKQPDRPKKRLDEKRTISIVETSKQGETTTALREDNQPLKENNNHPKKNNRNRNRSYRNEHKKGKGDGEA